MVADLPVEETEMFPAETKLRVFTPPLPGYVWVISRVSRRCRNDVDAARNGAVTFENPVDASGRASRAEFDREIPR